MLFPVRFGLEGRHVVFDGRDGVPGHMGPKPNELLAWQLHLGCHDSTQLKGPKSESEDGPAVMHQEFATSGE